MNGSEIARLTPRNGYERHEYEIINEDNDCTIRHEH